MKIRRHATMVDTSVEEGVERPGPGKAPTAFRIWRAGENVSDDGSIFFTKRSAELLLAEQASKGRVLSIDFDHLSLMNDRPAEAGRASGWHRLGVRGTDEKPELWAETVEWCADVKEGLEEQPPRWRFFSPAFLTDEETEEVTSYINLALCINPMTHGIPLLASQKLTKETPMTPEEMLAQLDAMIEAAQDPDQKAALVAAREALSAKKTDEGDDAGEPVVTNAADGGEGVKTTSEGEDKKDDEDEPKKTAAKAHARKAASDPVVSLTARLIELERRDEVREIDALLSKHTGLPDEFRAHCRKGTLAEAKVNVAAVLAVAGGTKTHSRKASASQPGGDGPALDPRDADALDRGMGLGGLKVVAPHKMNDGSGRFVMHNVRPSDMARLNAQKEKA